MYIYEFEFFEDSGWTLAYPMGLGYKAGTQGKDLNEAVAMAADLLKSVVEHSIIHKLHLPDPVYGHAPEHGGKVMVIGVDVSLDGIDAVRASEAALRLGVSRSRVSYMLRTGLLEGFRKGRDSYVTTASLEARLKEARKAGRPHKRAAA